MFGVRKQMERKVMRSDVTCLIFNMLRLFCGSGEPLGGAFHFKQGEVVIGLSSVDSCGLVITTLKTFVSLKSN